MKKVYFAVFGSGLGHAVRMLDVARELKKEGIEVVFSSYGEPADFIRKNGFKCIDIPPVDVHYSNDGALSPTATVMSFPLILFSSFIQYSYEMKNISRLNPSVVVSDSLPTSVVAGLVCRKPVITFLNQASIEPSRNLPNPVYRAITVGSYSGLTKVWNRSKKILVPDLPPPYTISEKNLKGLDERKILYTGFIIGESYERKDEMAVEFASDKRIKVFWSISGPRRTRHPVLAKAIEFASKYKEKYSVAISAGNPGGSTSPYKVRGSIFYEWCPVQDFLIRSCDVVISRAGHMTIGRIIHHGKPAILVPIKNQTEQEGNAEKAQKLGFALSLDQDNLEPEKVDRYIREIISGSYMERAVQLSSISRKLDPLRLSTETILSYF